MTTTPPAEIGMSLEDVDTPALLLDLEAFERNLDRMATAIADKPVVAATFKIAQMRRDRVGTDGARCRRPVLPESRRGGSHGGWRRT